MLARDLLSLTKPKIMSLLLISTCCPMILASGGQVSFLAMLLAAIGGILVSGSASGINCVWERDIDALMERTKERPVAAGRLSPRVGFLFSLAIGLLGLLVLAHFLSPAAALVALFGHLFYVFVYTIWLKRITPQNIVIGGAAGAVPPVVGWVAVTGQIELEALLMFLVVFLWTPPHFWALALNKNEDYQRAKIPMLPVVAGERETHRQMLYYALLLLPVSLLLVVVNELLGWFSLVVMSALGVLFIWKIRELQKAGQRNDVLSKEKQAWDVFGFSLVYLGLFFLCMVLDATVF